jgi:hypothetical protein
MIILHPYIKYTGEGWGARYIDITGSFECPDWVVFDTKEEAEGHIVRLRREFAQRWNVGHYPDKLNSCNQLIYRGVIVLENLK